MTFRDPVILSVIQLNNHDPAMLEKYTAVRTPSAGIISGRDAIYLDKMRFPNLVTVKFTGSLNTDLCDGLNVADDFLPYTLSFNSVVWFKLNELDFAGLDRIESSESETYWGESSFGIIENSKLVSTFQKHDHSSKISEHHKHYILYTCDIVLKSLRQNMF